MLSSECPSLLFSILDQYSASETSYRSYQEMSYAQQCDTQAVEHHERCPDKMSLLIYDRKPNDIITVLIDVVIDISLYSVIQNDETICHDESWSNDFVNNLPSDTTWIMACEPQLPVCFNIRALRTFLHSATYTYVCAHICRLIRNHVESALIVFYLECIDLCTLHVPDTPTSISIPLSLITSNRNVAIPTSLQTSLLQYLIRDWYRHKTGTMQKTTSLPSMDTRASMIDSFSPRYMVCRYDLDPNLQ